MAAGTYVPTTKTYVATGLYDPSANTAQRTVATHTLIGKPIPFGAKILRVWHDVETTFTSAADTATLEIGLTGWTGALRNAAAINAAGDIWDAARNVAPIAPANTLTSEAAGAHHISIAVAVQALTAGRMTVCVEYAITK